MKLSHYWMCHASLIVHVFGPMKRDNISLLMNLVKQKDMYLRALGNLQDSDDADFVSHLSSCLIHLE